MVDHTFDTVYVDESGDPGSKGSNYLVLTLWCVEENKKISKIVRKAKQKLLRKNKGARWLNRHGGEIKYSGFPDRKILEWMLKELSGTSSLLYYIAIKKKGKKILNSFKEMILSELFSYKAQVGSVPAKIIADKQYFHKKVAYCVLREIIGEIPGTNKKGKQYMLQAIGKEKYEKLNSKEWDHTLKIEHHNSRTNEHLQAIDVLSGAIFNYFENNDSSLFDILKKGKIQIKGKQLI